MTKKTVVSEWGLKPWEIDKLSAKDWQDIALAEHAETFIKQEQRERQKHGSGSINTKSGLEHRESKRKRIRQAKKGST